MNAKLKFFGILLTGVSLGLNAWLLSRWTNVKPSHKSEIVVPSAPVVERESIAQAPVRLVKQPFDWAVLESTNYPQYAKNLRDFGCPEPLVKTILERDIYGYYLDLRSKELAPLLTSFWDYTTNDEDHSRSMVRADIKNAETTVDSLLEELLHVQREDPFFARIRRRTAKANDVRLGFLSPEVREKVIAIEKQPDSTNSAVSRDEQIAQLLTPYELQEYRLRSSSAVRSLLNSSYVDAPAASLKEIVELYCNESDPKKDEDRSKMKEIVRSVAGDEAAQVYELSLNYRDYKTIYTFTEPTRPDPSVAIRLYSIQQETKKMLASNPDSTSAIIAEARRQVAGQIGTEQADVLFDRFHFPDL